MIRRPPRSTQSRSSAASDVYKRKPAAGLKTFEIGGLFDRGEFGHGSRTLGAGDCKGLELAAFDLLHGGGQVVKHDIHVAREQAHQGRPRAGVGNMRHDCLLYTSSEPTRLGMISYA